MAKYYLEFNFKREIDKENLDTEYEYIFVRSQLNKVLGAGKIHELDLVQVYNEDHQPIDFVNPPSEG